MVDILPNLVTDIEALFKGKDLTTRISHLTDKLGQEFVTRFLEYSEEREPTLRLSNIGTPCIRKLWYELKGYKGEELSAQAKMKFLYGTICELLVLFLAKEAGYTLTDEQKEVEVDGVIGHIDGILNGVLIDVKSCSPISFNKFKYKELYQNDPFGYLAQLSAYKQAIGVEKSAFIAIDKSSGEICILELKEEHEQDVRARIRTIREAVKRDSPPLRAYEPIPVSKTSRSENRVLPIGCVYCNHKFECYKETNRGQGLLIRYYSTGPKFFANLVEEPRLREDRRESQSTPDVFPVKE